MVALTLKPTIITAAFAVLGLFCQGINCAPVESSFALDARAADPQPDPHPAANALTPRAQTVTSPASRTGVSGSCTFTWASEFSITGIHCTVQDTKCDANDVYIYLQVTPLSGTGGSVNVGRLGNASGCHAGAVEDNGRHSYNPGGTILTAQVIVCVDDFGSDSCSGGAVSYMPYW